MQIKLLGVDDSKTTCDCCGKSNLKKTIVLDVEGDTKYYGANCAAKALGFTDKSYSASNIHDLERRYQTREKIASKLKVLESSATGQAEQSGKAHIVVRRACNGQASYFVTEEETFVRRNIFGHKVVFRTQEQRQDF